MVTEQQMESIEHWALRLEDPGRPLLKLCAEAPRLSNIRDEAMTEGEVLFAVAEKVREAMEIVENNISSGLVLAARDVGGLLADADALLVGLLEAKAEDRYGD